MSWVRPSRFLRSAVAGTALTLTLVTVAATPASARPKPPAPVGRGTPPAVAGHATVARPNAARPLPLPARSGSVPLNRSAHVTSPAVGPLAVTPLAATTDSVAVRALVLATTTDDFGVATWKATLDRLGAAYDVVYTATTPINAGALVRTDGVGRYNAVLLTSSSLLYQNSSGGYVSGLDATGWNTLWSYERDYGVRQAVLYGSYGTWPENYCLQETSEGGVGTTPLNASLTAAGASIFDYLKPDAQIPLTQSYVYHTSVTAGCSAQPVLTAGNDVLGVLSTSTDGRERLELTFSNNQYLLQSDLLVYGLVRWATRGLFFGDQKHYLDIDIDDWFNSSDEYLPTGQVVANGWQMTAADAYNLSLQEAAIRQQYPAAANLKFALAYNGGDADLTAGNTCSPTGWIDQLTATSRCLSADFGWINHTADHVELNSTDYATTHAQIANNITDAATLGLPIDPTVLKTPGYSGLGTYNPDPNNDIDPPTDHGLGASNPALLQAATDLGVKYLHGNMSFPSQVPACFNCAIAHPLAPNLSIVPDWPTNIAYDATTPDEETAFYNYLYGPTGKFPYWSTNLNYSQAVSADTDIALQHLTSGSVYTHTFHIGNARNYASGGTLLSDWLTSLLAKYTSYYTVPLLSPGWPGIADQAVARTAHFATLAGGVEAIYNRTSNTVTVTSPVAGAVSMTGAQVTGSTTYGTDVSATLTLAANTPVTFTPALRS